MLLHIILVIKNKNTFTSEYFKQCTNILCLVLNQENYIQTGVLVKSR